LSEIGRLPSWLDVSSWLAQVRVNLNADRPTLGFTNVLEYGGEPLGPEAEREADDFVAFLQSR